MNKEPLIPSLNSTENNSSRDLIIKILSNEWPLSAKEIYSRVQKINQKSISYQAIHKTIKQLVNNGTLIKDHNKKLQLSIEWITNIEKYSSNLRSAYLDKQKTNLKDLYKESQASLTFENPLELGSFLCNTYFNYPNPKNKCTVLHLFHNYPPIGMPVKDMLILKQSIIPV